jgi:hypothetical protein
LEVFAAVTSLATALSGLGRQIPVGKGLDDDLKAVPPRGPIA